MSDYGMTPADYVWGIGVCVVTGAIILAGLLLLGWVLEVPL